MSSVVESRGIQYSAEAAGEPGNLRCHIIRLWLAQERRAQYSIFVSNGTDTDAQGVAFIPDGPDGNQRTILQTFIGRCSDFSTSVFLEITPAGLMPELRVTLTGNGGTYFTLVVPGLAADDRLDGRSSGSGWLALPTASAAQPNVPAVRGAYAPPAPPFVTTAQNNPSATVREIPAPPVRPRSSPPVLLAVLFFMALLVGIGFFVARPQVVSFVVPPVALSGATVTVSYRATGLGTANYAVLGPDGQTIVSGPLAPGSGTFALTVPQTPAVPAYLVRLQMSNSLASADAEQYLRVQTPPAPKPAPPKRRAPPPAPPQIRSLALDRATLTSGDNLTVYYDVSATSGSVALYDPVSQIAYEKSAISPSGHSTFVAPHVDGVRFFTVIATAQRGNATTQSRIGVTVTPGATPLPLADAGATDDATVSGPASNAAISAPATARSGQTIHVEMRGSGNALELALIDGSGRAIARRGLQDGQRGVDFTAPPVTKPTRLVFEATYPNGVGTETVVRPIVVTP